MDRNNSSELQNYKITLAGVPGKAERILSRSSYWRLFFSARDFVSGLLSALISESIFDIVRFIRSSIPASFGEGSTWNSFSPDLTAHSPDPPPSLQNIFLCKTSFFPSITGRRFESHSLKHCWQNIQWNDRYINFTTSLESCRPWHNKSSTDTTFKIALFIVSGLGIER